MSRILCTSTSSRLLHLLASGGPLDVLSIAQALDLKPARVRHQLCALRRRGFVARTGLSSCAGSPHIASPFEYEAVPCQVDRGLSKLLVDFGADNE